MRNVYLDNAATTPLSEEVLEAMMPYLTTFYGNPSSVHHLGRKSKAAIEEARRTIAGFLNCSPAELFFTSGGTEADNLALYGAVLDLDVKHAITTAIEHKAVLETLKGWKAEGKIRLSIVRLTADGSVDLEHLETLLRTKDKTLVSLMHANNEIGNLLPLKKVGEMCRKYNAYFHSDTVQTMGHYRFDLADLNVDFITGSAHKFHGPKGVGFLYVKKGLKINAMITGGGQERNMRAGTEPVYAIVGLAKAMEIAYHKLDEHRAHIEAVKFRMVEKLKEKISGIRFNGRSHTDGLYTVLSCCLPESDKGDMLLYSLDLYGIACSGGSACNSGASKGSHVLQAIGANLLRPNVRFSFSRYTTFEDVEYAADQLAMFYPVIAR